jgi:cytochrome P450
VQVSIAASQRHGADPEDLAIFRPQRHLAGDTTVTLLPYGGGERVCLGKALAELEIRLLAVGLPRPQAERAGGTSCAAPKR